MEIRPSLNKLLKEFFRYGKFCTVFYCFYPSVGNGVCWDDPGGLVPVLCYPYESWVAVHRTVNLSSIIRLVSSDGTPQTGVEIADFRVARITDMSTHATSGIDQF